MALHGNMMLAPAGDYSGYQIDQSMVLDGSSDYLSWTPAVAGTDSTRFSFSCFLKFCEFDRAQSFFSAGSSNTNRTNIAIESSNKIQFTQRVSSSTISNVSTNAVFRDPGSWYHVVVIYNSNEASSSDRIKIIVNGVEQTLTHTDAIDSARAVHFAAANEHAFGLRVGTPSQYFNGYIADPLYLDGQVEADATFAGEFYNGTTAWRPIQPSGLTYGTNGFYLPFTQDTPNLGVDYSGNGADWTENGSPVQSSDSPTVNYCTWNANDKQSTITLTEGNLAFSCSSGGQDSARGTIFVSSGKWYWEVERTSGTHCEIGIGTNAVDLSDSPGSDANGYGYRSFDGKKINNNSVVSYGDTYAAGDIVGIALDMDNGAIWFSKNGTWQNSATVGEIEAGTTTNAAYTGLIGEFTPMMSNESSAVATANFGQTAFSYTAPTGFVALTAANLPEVTITDPGEYFNAVAYTGDGTAIGSGGNSITGVGFQSDFTWIKNRDATDSHMLFDVIRGATKVLHSNETAAETTESETLTSFDSDGFTLGSDVEVNTNTEDYISWNWKAGGAGVANTDGTISSTVSVNDDAGFSIATWASPLSATTIGHGLSAEPELIIAREYDGVMSWRVYHKDVGNGHYLLLDTTGAKSATSDWNSTDPTSSVFSVSDRFNTAGNYIAYCFRSIPGYSKVFSYTGNGSADGPFVYLGFKPRWVIYKRSDSTGAWEIFDTERSGYNLVDDKLFADASTAETVADGIDILSNGFKFRSSGASRNASGGTYIGIAFAENPFGGSNLPLGLAQ